MLRSMITEDYTCKRKFKDPEVTSDWIAKKMFTIIKNNPSIGFDALSTDLCRIFSVETIKKRLFIAKKKVLKLVAVDFTSSYTRLQEYEHILLVKN